jgi:AcrR family transcriptional regulator
MNSSESSAKRAPRVDAQRNRERLLQAARERVAVLGPNASLEDIAKRADVGIGTLYRHFPTRDDLLAAVCEDQVEGLLRLAGELRANCGSGEAFAEWLRAAVTEMVRFRELRVILARDLASGYRLSNPGKDRLLREVGPLLDDAMAAGRVRSDVSLALLFGMVSGIPAAAEMSDDPEAAAQLLLAVVLAGLSAQAGPHA